MWRNVGKAFRKLSWLKYFFWALCAFCFFHHHQPMLHDHSDSMHSESINTAATKGCTGKSIFCSDLWVFLLVYQVSFWVLWIPGEIWPVGIPSSIPFNLAEPCWAVFYKRAVAYVLIFPIMCSPLPMFLIPISKKFYFWLWLMYPKGAQ